MLTFKHFRMSKYDANTTLLVPKYLHCFYYRWRFVIFGAIDGFSRLIVYLVCKNNNLAETGLQEFLTGIEKFGLPSRVRTDQGVENVDIARFMLTHPERGEGRGSHITGKSVHNQRIERLWRDVYHGCTVKYYWLFRFMEEQGILDTNNDVHLFCLHFVFIPRIHQHLSDFANGWNNHAITTEQNRTPYQLWIQGMFNLSNSTHRAAREFWNPDNIVSYLGINITEKQLIHF